MIRKLFILSLAAGAEMAAAHDFWIEPGRFNGAPGRPIPLSLEVGERFQGAPVPAPTDGSGRFTAVGPSGVLPVRTIPGAHPAGWITAVENGAIAVGYESAPQAIELPADRFERYLLEEGLEWVVAARAAAGESERAGRERFSRSAKTLLVAGTAAVVDGAVVGLPLELSPVTPLAAGAPLTVEATFRDRPLAALQVVAIPESGVGETHRATTDDAGRVELPLDRGGRWLIKAVHMTRDDHPESDWRSWWASLTFAVPAD